MQHYLLPILVGGHFEHIAEVLEHFRCVCPDGVDPELSGTVKRKVMEVSDLDI